MTRLEPPRQRARRRSLHHFLSSCLPAAARRESWACPRPRVGKPATPCWQRGAWLGHPHPRRPLLRLPPALRDPEPLQGDPAEAEVLASACRPLSVPVLAVLGNGEVPVYNVSVPVIGRSFWTLELTSVAAPATPIH